MPIVEKLTEPLCKEPPKNYFTQFHSSIKELPKNNLTREDCSIKLIAQMGCYYCWVNLFFKIPERNGKKDGREQ
ncbi:MAG: hypothetical protein D3923_05475 [Candidatus Electrothrix sp. AR3]|nr:hypothetical protein [Candidatus Electrothrix sp. AR3]